MESVFSGLITSRMRARILMRLFLNPERRAYLRELAGEFKASPSQVREELRNLKAAGLVDGERRGRQIFYRANASHPLFPELQSMVRKALGMDRILDSIVERLGELRSAYLLDDYAEGKDTGIIDLLLVGEINRPNLDDLVVKTEKHVGRRIRTLILDGNSPSELAGILNSRPHLLLWNVPSR